MADSLLVYRSFFFVRFLIHQSLLSFSIIINTLILGFFPPYPISLQYLLVCKTYFKSAKESVQVCEESGGDRRSW